MKYISQILQMTAAAALVMFALSCSREEIETPAEPEAPVKTTLKIGVAPELKTYLGTETGSRKVYWSNGDQIAVNGVESEALANLADNTLTADFTFEGALTKPYNVIYPASIYTDETHVTLPAIQDYKAGSFADGMFPMVGYSADGNPSLSHLCAVLKVSVLRAPGNDADTDNLVSVTFKGRNNEQVSGSFTIDYQHATLTGASSGAADQEVKVVKTLATSTSNAAVYFIVVPAGTYNGFDITVQDTQGHIMTKNKASSATLEAGHLYNLTEFAFVPTGTATGIEISNAEELVAFAQAYNRGDFVGREDLVVTLIDDIDFSEGSANSDFTATRGIGTKKGDFDTEADNYFYGVFNGAGHTISNYAANVPLFKYTRSATVIENFTMDNSCSLSFTQPSDAEGDFGAVVGYHKGLVKNVIINATLSLVAGTSVSQHTAFGGIVGNLNNGTIENCVYGGNIIVPSGFAVNTGKKLMIGGIAAYVSNASGTISGTDFNGTICNEGKVLDNSNQSNPFLIIGGIVGYGQGSISNCKTTDHPTVDSAYSSDGGTTYLQGTIVNKTTVAYCCAVGGIIGENLSSGSVSSCTNNATVLTTFFKDGDENTKGRRLRVGGIAGKNIGSITNSNNYGTLTIRSNPFFQYLGGITGWNTGGTVKGCTNSGNLEIAAAGTGSNGPRYAFFGGAIGENDGTATVSDVNNVAQLELTEVEEIGTCYVRMGGVIGSNFSAIDGGTGKTITNSGNISVTNDNSTKFTTGSGDNDYGFFLGGIVGWTKQGVANATNNGDVTYNCTAAGVGVRYVYLGGVAAKVLASSAVDIDKCSNTGDLTFVPDATAPHSGGAVYNYCYLGGIAGYANNANIKGNSSTKCTNSGIIYGGEGLSNQNTTTPENSFWVGGIVGYLTGSSSISYCELSGNGQSCNNHWCNRGSSWKTSISTSMYTAPPPACGGIVGEVIGTSDSSISISNCSIASTASVSARRGACGGIAGISQYAVISNCAVPVSISKGYWNGGIVAAAYGTSVTSCNYNGSSVAGTNESGGIVGYLDTGSSISSCNSYATSLTTSALYGGLAGSSVSGTTISNSHCKTGKQLCSDTNFTDGGGNAADL